MFSIKETVHKMFDQNVYEDRVVEKYIMFYNSIMDGRNNNHSKHQSYKKSSENEWIDIEFFKD